MSSLRFVTAALTVGAAAACASSASLTRVPTPEEVPILEAALAADPTDVEAGVGLAAAYREAGRLDEARELLSALEELLPEDPGVLAMSGVLAEEAGEHAAAREAYRAALASGVGGDLRAELERRLERVRREELRAEVQAALAREDEVAQTPPDPGTVGVFPFFYEGSDPDWEPLALALPEMLATDLGVTGRLRVLERMHVQALLDEMALGASGRVDEATAARSGRLLGSGNIVQGRLRIDGGTRVGVDAAVVEVGGSGTAQVDPLSDEDAVEQLFALEKRLALDLHEELGVQLTPAERERINERQTESVQALLAFGRGIAAENAGDYDQARQHFDAAASIDPSFGLARSYARAAALLANPGALATASRVSSLALRISTQRQAVQLLRDAPADLRQRILSTLSPEKRAILAELLGQDRVGQAILLELVFVGPGGDR